MPPTAGSLTLLTGPAGSGKTHAALGRIRAAATTPGARGRDATAPDEALLVLPTYAQVNHVKRRALSRWGVRGIFDRPFTTFTAAGERFLEDFRVRSLPSPEERDRLMEAALASCDVPLFEAIGERPGFRAHLLRLVKELKQTGLEGGEAREHLAAARDEVSPASRRKLEAFLEVFQAYEDLLERAGLEDHEDALRRLAHELAERPLQAPPRLLVVDGFDDFSRVEERILDGLAAAVTGAGGEVLVTLPWDPARPHVFATSRGTRRRLLEAGYVETALAGFERSDAAPLEAIAADLFGGSAARMPGGEAVVSITAGDAEDEAESVARAVRALRTPEGFVDGVRGWRDVGVVVRSLASHAARLESAFARLGVPLRIVGGGEALASEPIVRALRGPLAVLGGAGEGPAFEAGDVVAWMRWRALVGGDATTVEAVDAWDMRFRQYGFPRSLRAMLAEAPEELRPALASLQDASQALAAAADGDARLACLEALLPGLVPLPEPSGFDPDGRPLDPAHDARLARAVAALARVGGILAALREAAERTGEGAATDAAETVAQLVEAIDITTFQPQERRLDAVTLMDAEEARFWELPVVVVAGLEEGMFPLRPREDVLLRDADRSALRAKDPTLRLPLALDREARERRLFYGAVTRATQQLVLVRRAYDDKGDPKERSTYLHELEAVVEPTVRAEARTPGRVVRPLEECFTEDDLRLLAAGRLGPWFAVDTTDADAVDEHERLRALAPALQSLTATPAPGRLRRLRRRASDPLHVDEATLAVARRAFPASVARTSVSSLNHGVLCPYRFFLAKVARIPQDDYRLDGPVFDNRQRGSALHHAFELALRHPDWSPARLAAEGIAEVGAEGIDEPLLRDELERATALLRERERATAGTLVPWKDGLEYDFRDEQAIEIGPKDCRFELGGQVDRIDRTDLDAAGVVVGEDGLASIVDYKRSAGSAKGYFEHARDGLDLQLPLYARALEERLGVTVVGFEWVAGLTRDRRIIHDAAAAALFEGRRENAPLEADTSEAFRARIADAEATAADVVRRARRGDHTRAPAAEGTCEACWWHDVCRPDIAWLEEQIPAPAEDDDAAEGSDA